MLPSKMKLSYKTWGYLGGCLIVIFSILYFSSVRAVTTTNTMLGIAVGSFSFYKDVTSHMNPYFSHSPNAATGIDMGIYAASLSAIDASSSGDHRFTVSDMIGSPFTITIQSSNMTASGIVDIPASAVTYTGTDWMGTGTSLTSTGSPGTPLNNVVVFVSRTGIGLSEYAQEITLHVLIPAAQAPASYTGVLTFTQTP